jgi:large conductance mechanosensitive channel
MLSQFKEFAVKGNVVDMAVGVMIGAAFGAVVKSLVDDVLMPPLGLLTGRLDFKDHFLVLQAGTTPEPYATLEAARTAGATVLSYGMFVNACVSFLLISLALFFVVRWMNALRSPDTPPAPATRACPHCMSPIHIKATRCPHCTSELADVALPAG